MRFVGALLLAATTLATTCSAFADVVPPPGDCAGKKEGEACKDEAKRAGACGTITTTATNHATNPPTSSQRSYFACRAGDKPTVSADEKCSVSIVGAPESWSLGALATCVLVLALGARRGSRTGRGR